MKKRRVLWKLYQIAVNNGEAIAFSHRHGRRSWWPHHNLQSQASGEMVLTKSMSIAVVTTWSWSQITGSSLHLGCKGFWETPMKMWTVMRLSQQDNSIVLVKDWGDCRKGTSLATETQSIGFLDLISPCHVLKANVLSLVSFPGNAGSLWWVLSLLDKRKSDSEGNLRTVLLEFEREKMSQGRQLKILATTRKKMVKRRDEVTFF